MIRFARADDRAELMDVAAAIGLFPSESLPEIGDMVDAFFAGTLGDRHWWLVDDHDGTLAGVAYCAPERMTDGTWNLYLIGVRPERQRTGRGAAMVAWIEAELVRLKARILIVETSGLGTFEATRAFYRRCGYEEEARIREFYAVGEDKVVFRKELSDVGTGSTAP